MIFSKANLGTLSTSVFIQACGAFTGILTARILGPMARGELATILLWPPVFSNLGLLGCNCALAREVGRDPEAERDWAVSGLVLGVAYALLSFLAGFLLIPLLIPSDRKYLVPLARYCMLLIPLDMLKQVLLAVEHGRMRWRSYNLLRASFFLFYLALVICAGIFRFGRVSWLVSAFLASHLLSILARLWVQGRFRFAGKLRLDYVRHLSRAGIPYSVAMLSYLTMLQLDTILVVSLFSTRAAGLYAVAGTFATGQASLGEALGTTSFAEVSNEKDAASQEALITETFRQSVLVSIGASFLIACAIPYAIKPLFGSDYSLAIGPAVILAMAASLTTSANILNQSLRGAGRPHAGIMSQAVGIGVLAGTALLYLRRFGLAGIAWAVMLSAFAQVLVLVAGAAAWLGISPARFWPLSAQNVRLLWQQAAGLPVRLLRSLA